MKRNTMRGWTGAAAILALGAVGCGGPENFDPEKPSVSQTKKESPEKADAWGANDNPSIFNSTLVYKYSALPDVGEVTNIPWAASYWPVYEDSINYKWDGSSSESAPKKFERAFGLTGVEDAVSKFHGIDSQSSRKECKETTECSDLKDGSQCAKRPGAEKGRCIPTWWGICHAWAPASILMPEPKREVTKNGVTFKINDLKALVELVHNRTGSKFVSLRCEQQEGYEGLPESSTLRYDNYGRPLNAACKDTNAGTYHLLITNYLGLLKQSFVEDRTFNYEVWNQPLRGYRITSKKELSATEANRLVGVTTVGGTTIDKNGTVAKDAWVHQEPIAVTAGQTFKVQMTGDNDADLYVNFGAQPTAATYACRPYDSGSAESCELTVPAGQTQAFVSVAGYAPSSTFQLKITSGGSVPTAYQFNPAAVKFVQVALEVDYIGESSSSTDGNLSANIARYTHTDYYDYILEIDANDKIVGGEWLNDSKKRHPDFLWLPTAVQTTSVAGGKITYAQVKALLDESVGPATPPPSGNPTEKVVNDQGALTKNQWKAFGPYNVAAGATFKAELDGTGDVDLYVRKSAAATLGNYDCRPYQSGSKESCSIVGPAVVYVGLNGYATSSSYTLKLTYVEGGGTVTPPPVVPTWTNLSESGTVALNEMKVFPVQIPAGKQITIRTESQVDVDLYVQFGAAPTTSSYLSRGYTASGNETLTYKATENGTLYLGVHGYAAGAFKLVATE